MVGLGVTGMEGRMLGKLTFTIPTRIKKRVLFVALVFLAVWPILHHGLVTTYEINPWIFFGLSMYVRANPMPDIVAMEAAYPGQTFQAVNRDALRASLPLRQSLRTLVDGRSSYGTLYNPETVVEEIFDEFPSDIDRLAFTMQLLNLDAKGVLMARNLRTECRKGKERSEVECVVAPAAGRTRSP